MKYPFYIYFVFVLNFSYSATYWAAMVSGFLPHDPMNLAVFGANFLPFLLWSPKDILGFKSWT